ncbi:MAG: hypothetical protein ACRC1W_17170 [Shewanella sp.]
MKRTTDEQQENLRFSASASLGELYLVAEIRDALASELPPRRWITAFGRLCLCEFSNSVGNGDQLVARLREMKQQKERLAKASYRQLLN